MATIASARASPDVPSMAEKKVSASETRVQAVDRVAEPPVDRRQERRAVGDLERASRPGGRCRGSGARGPSRLRSRRARKNDSTSAWRARWRPPRRRRRGTGRAPLLVVAERFAVLRDHRQEPEVVVGVGQQDGIAGRRGQLEPLLVGGPGRREVLHPVGEAAFRGEPGDPDADVVAATGGRAARPAGRAPRGAGRAAGTSARSRRRSGGPRAGSSFGDGPVDRGAQVAVLAIEAAHVRLTGRAEDRAAGRLGDRRRTTARSGSRAVGRSPLSSRRSSAYSRRIGWRLNRASSRSRRWRRRQPTSIRTRLLSASDSRPVSTSMPRSPSGSATDQAASAVQPLAKTASLANSRRSSALSSSWLQATAPRSVRCRSGRSRVPPARSRLRPSRSRIEAGLMHPDPGGRELERERQAVEAFADRPDRGQRRRRRGRCPGDAHGRDPRTGRRRPSTSSGGMGWPRSPAIRSSSRLVTRTHRSARRGPARPRRPPRRAGAARDCRARGAPSGPAGGPGAPRRSRASGDSRTPSVAAIAASRSDGSRSAARSTNQTPCG